MRLTITAGGSRGDTQPFVALGRGLSSAGHEVTIATHAAYEEFVRSHGLGFHEVYGDPEADMARLTGDGSAPGPVEFARRNRENMRATLTPMLADYIEACRSSDAVLYTYPGFMGHFAGRELGKPIIGAFVEPFSEPTTAFQSALLPEAPPPLARVALPVANPAGGANLAAAYNRASHALMGQLFWQLLRGPANEALAANGADRLPFWGPFKRARDERVPAVYGFSPRVVADPPDWGEHLEVTGFWFMDEAGHADSPTGLEPELSEFLERGGPLVSVGFGSTVESDAGALADLIAGAVRDAGARAVVVAGWSGLGNASAFDSEEFHVVEETPYSLLFGRVDAAVHHGGAGTAAEAFRAGVPQMIVPSYHGQPFWASMTARSGAGPAPIHRKNLTRPALAGAIRQALSSESMRASAARIGEGVRAEDGIGHAVKSIESFAAAARTP